jgi:Tfp pilus assembly protein PilV
MLTVVIQSGITLSDVMLSAFILSVIMLSVVVEPYRLNYKQFSVTWNTHKIACFGQTL